MPEKTKNKIKWTHFTSSQKLRTILLAGLSGLLLTAFLVHACIQLYSDKKAEEIYWEEHFLAPSDDILEKVAGKSAAAVPVTSGTYLETIKELNIKSGFFRIEFLVWFCWEGHTNLNMKDHFRIYNATINKKDIIKDVYDPKTDLTYQQIRCDASVYQPFCTVRFPLENHQLRFYVESDYPVEKAVFIEGKNSGVLNPDLSVNGYKITRNTSFVTAFAYPDKHDDPTMEGELVHSELVSALELNRSSFGVYWKCTISLIGTTIWMFLILFVNAHHTVDPLGLIPPILVGAISNVIVGTNLLPDALQTGLIEYINLLGMMSLILIAITVINVNRVRNKDGDGTFAQFLGHLMFTILLTIVAAGFILIPLCAYHW